MTILPTLLLTSLLAVTGAEVDVLEGRQPRGAERLVMKFKVRDVSGQGRAKLEAKSYDVYHPHKRDSSVMEVFGHDEHMYELQRMGLELLEVDVGDAFQGDGYTKPEDLEPTFREFVTKHPDKAEFIDITKLTGMSKTVQGRSIFGLKVTGDLKAGAVKPRVLLVSNHHAREVITPELAIHFAKQLLEGSDSDVKSILDKFEVFIIPTMNPDGLAAVYSTNSWKRTNANGVDLNRNYPVGWDLSCAGQNSGGETFRGPKPFSEVETQTMEAFQKKMNFAKLLDFHSYSEEVRTNYGPCSALPVKIDKFFQRISGKIASAVNYDNSRSCCMGGDIHYAYNRHGTLSYLIETGNQFQPRASEKNKVLAQVWPGVKYFLQVPISISGKITDESGKPLSDVAIELPDYNWNLKETRHSGENGMYHLWMPAGDHRVVFKHNGNTKSMTLIASESGKVHDIEFSSTS